MSSERSFDSESMARRFRGLASMGCAQDRRPMVHAVAVLRRSPVLTALLAGLLAVGACSHDGRTLAPTRPDQTTTTTGVPEIGATGDPITTFTLVTDVVEDGGELPVRFTCF